MVEKMKSRYSKWIQVWNNRTLAQKSIVIGGIVAILLIFFIFLFLSNNPKLVPLYSNLSLQETGQIKTELDSRGIQYEVGNGGTTISVPREQVDTLLVDLAAQGLPNSGNIDYSFFSENASWGMTDGQRKMIELDALQTELSNLITSIEGIQSTQVLITKPQESIFIGEQADAATASIVIHTEPGYTFNQDQINGLYHLVSKSVPNLPTDNIVLMNQYFEYFDVKNPNDFSVGSTYVEQMDIKKDIEQDIQRRVQQMIGTMIGRDNVVVSVTTDLDFTQENRTEEVVQPVDLETMEGLPISVERITETYTGNNPPTGTVGTGEDDIPNYPANGEDGVTDYEMVKESINNEFNRIQKNIVESPYKIRDLGIQVAVDSKKDQTDENGEVEYLSAQEQEMVQESISSILNSIVSTTVSKDFGNINPQEKISIVFEEFSQQPLSQPTPTPVIPKWLYVAGGALVLAVLILLFMVLRKKKSVEEDYVELQEEERSVSIPNIDDKVETEEGLRRKQLENMAKEKPEDFAKLLRTWITED
ncbi:flagellar M-ring protein FliF [Salirhabdus euzebyi]|uniref:Flagellar M-ring protein n=1 Tax=Salirhabdus euzebyi TaxID=394506 RepID=A0A841Q3G5_9BACI|nr:flagellar basal-body MS-ring/collar protein FliF [Salirhabdus euzebyi]MBB6452927.1 flagellar M-ring protein FliF [Salirhabdus euzebyi]